MVRKRNKEKIVIVMNIYIEWVEEKFEIDIWLRLGSHDQLN